jgi:putative copper resistance protein D
MNGQAVAIPLIHATAIRFRWIGWGTLGLLITTGIADLIFRGYGWEQLRNGSLWQSSFGHVLGIKLVLIVVILIVSAWHDIFVGPQFTRVGQEDPHSPHTRRLRRLAAWAGRVILILSVVAVVLGVMLVRGIPQ